MTHPSPIVIDEWMKKTGLEIDTDNLWNKQGDSRLIKISKILQHDFILPFTIWNAYDSIQNVLLKYPNKKKESTLLTDWKVMSEIIGYLMMMWERRKMVMMFGIDMFHRFCVCRQRSSFIFVIVCCFHSFKREHVCYKPMKYWVEGWTTGQESLIQCL